MRLGQLRSRVQTIVAFFQIAPSTDHSSTQITWSSKASEQEDLTRHSKAAHVKAFQEATKGNIEAKVQVFQPV